MSLIQELEAYIAKTGTVSMVEIEAFCHKSGMDTKGKQAFGMADKNVWFWFGMSDAFADVMLELQARNEVAPKPTTILVYAIDGAAPKVPVASSRIPPGGYKKPRWLPVVFNVAAGP